MSDTADGYDHHPAETWDRAFAAYEAGESAPSVCRRLGLNLSTFRDRARREGRRRCDADPLDQSWDDAPEEVDTDPIAMSKAAWRQAAVAVARGDAMAALRWSRVAAEFRQVARDSLDEADRCAARDQLDALTDLQDAGADSLAALHQAQADARPRREEPPEEVLRRTAAARAGIDFARRLVRPLITVAEPADPHHSHPFFSREALLTSAAGVDAAPPETPAISTHPAGAYMIGSSTRPAERPGADVLKAPPWPTS